MKFIERYQLDNGQFGQKIKISCPECEKPKRFTRYVDLEAGEYLPAHVGLCDRFNSCGYHYRAIDYVKENKTVITRPIGRVYLKAKPQRIDFIPQELFNEYNSLDGSNNPFVKWLYCMYAERKVNKALDSYRVTVDPQNNIIFWQFDTQGRIRTGKVFQYNNDGHRVKQWFIHKNGFICKQVLFGVHLLDELSGYETPY